MRKKLLAALLLLGLFAPAYGVLTGPDLTPSPELIPTVISGGDVVVGGTTPASPPAVQRAAAVPAKSVKNPLTETVYVPNNDSLGSGVSPTVRIYTKSGSGTR